MFRFGEPHRSEMIEFVGEDEVLKMERFEEEALVRGAIVKDEWCKCYRTLIFHEEYYRRDDGRHGMFHTDCRRITQTG